MRVPLAHIPLSLQKAVIASEDGRFYEHYGVDWQALWEALMANLHARRFRQGGSTITMQAARYAFLPPGRSLARKMAEIPLALYMERRLGKARILELYFNQAFYGLGARDIQSAAQTYFGKDYRTLTAGETMFLAGIFPEPPSTRRAVTLEFSLRCRERALHRFRFFFPADCPDALFATVLRSRLNFAWRYAEKHIPHQKGTSK